MGLIATSPSPPPPKKTESPVAKLVISAGITWVYELGIGHYLEFIKIVKQTNSGSYLQLTKQITSDKGLIGIWDGFFPWGTIQAVAKGAVFGWGHALAKSSLQPLVQSNYINQDAIEIISGGIGGGLQGLVLSPTLLLKTRVMTDPIFRTKMGMLETSKRSATAGLNVIKNEGLLALMKGAPIYSCKRVADWSTRFFFSVQVENLLYKQGNPDYVLSYQQKMISSLLGGSLSALATLPMDVMVAQIQQASKAGAKVSVIQTIRQQLQDGGISGMMGFVSKGFVARVTHVALTTMLLKTGASACYEFYEQYVDDN